VHNTGDRSLFFSPTEALIFQYVRTTWNGGSKKGNVLHIPLTVRTNRKRRRATLRRIFTCLDRARRTPGIIL